MQDSLGCLFIVATPIGNLGDISQRAIEVLSTVSKIAAEDTRHTGKLLQHLGVQKPMLSLHEHNERTKFQQILDELQAGNDIALVSDAGTPCISDPGYWLVKQAHEQGFKVVPVPGACAAIAALSASGLATDKFMFEGFLPAKSAARKNILQQLVARETTSIFYESCHRIVASLKDMQEVLGGDRNITVAREVTKTFETIKKATLAEIITWVEQDNNQQKGEFVLVVAGVKKEKEDNISAEAKKMMALLVQELPRKKVAKIVAEMTGADKKALYQTGL